MYDIAAATSFTSLDEESALGAQSEQLLAFRRERQSMLAKQKQEAIQE